MTRRSTRVRFWAPVLTGGLLGLGLLAARVRPNPTPPSRPTASAPVRTAADAVAENTWTVWLYLDRDASRTDAPPALSAAALARRQQQGIAVTDGDRPIAPRLLREIRRTGAAVRVQSRWLRAVSVTATTAQLRALDRLPFVRRIAPVGRLAAAGGPPSGAGRAPAPPFRPSWFAAPGPGFGPDNDSTYYGVNNYPALLGLGIPQVHDLQLSGVGIGIAILDGGFERQHVALRQRIVAAQYDFINGDTIVANQAGEPDQEVHGTEVWSLIGGFYPNLIVGPAYNATFFLAKVDAEPGDTRADEDRWVQAAEWADSVGARIINSSVFFRTDFTDRPPIPFQDLNGNLTATTIAADEAARRGILVVQAVGNAVLGDLLLSAPADADSVLSVGAVDLSGAPWQEGVLASARGPTADGRTKPEVVAVGANLAAANSVNQVGLNYARVGTSYSTALMAGAAALFMEAWPGLTAEAVWRALLQAGDNHSAPNNLVGWGMPNVAAAIMLPDGLTAASITPRDLKGNPTSLAPVFNWDAPLISSRTRPLTFRLELAADSLFQQIVASDTVHDAFSLALRSPLRPGRVLWWRVTAESPNGIRRRSDVAGPFTVQHWVTLVSLAGDQTTFTETIRPELTWTALPAPPPAGPLTYDVEVLDQRTGDVVDRIRDLTTTRIRVRSALAPNGAYRWRVIARTQQGMVDTVTSVHPFVVNSSENPPATILYQNFPNPFPAYDLGVMKTTIWFDLSSAAIVELTVHDLRGRLLRSLIPTRESCPPQLLPAGAYGRPGSPYPLDGNDCVTTSWDGRDQQGERLPRGVYVLRLLTNGRPAYRRMLYQPN